LSELKSIATRMISVFKHFSMKRSRFLSTKLLLGMPHLWKDIEDGTFERAIDEPLEKDWLIEKMEKMPWFFLTEIEDDYLKGRK